MSIRPEVAALVAAGPLPSEDDATVEQLERIERLLDGIAEPISDDEALAMLDVFGPDGCYGMAWTVLHLIEKAPGVYTNSYSTNAQNEWVQLLEQRRAP